MRKFTYLGEKVRARGGHVSLFLLLEQDLDGLRFVNVASDFVSFGFP